ncbi:thermonuclease family protein [Actinomycetospora straminea]|uniref:Endonuclease YncB(Thermonuclease family) n=1 Tax=Actinomycetospora straminea TaxID=663607 RepID=A0ABP9ETR8_9PSEU|nr:thermonuclease family protein [Actinomycetospora straminea]MDD7933532.1 thermonuclease family protein [Actinomycetospora straminea]
MSAKGLFGGALVLIAVIGGCHSAMDDATPTGSSSRYSSAPASPSTAAPLPARASAPSSATEAAMSASRVARVIDGDSFVLDDGHEVRVLGIDSCEMSSDRGDDAKSAAEAYLTGTTITLMAEPGVDRDSYGRLLRYVRIGDGSDLGESMVVSSHTAVYAGDNDASPQRLADLRALDAGGRDCDEPEYTPAPDPDPVYVPDTADDDDTAVHTPRRRTGNTGHPCLPGERDGDGDGYCKEGR